MTEPKKHQVEIWSDIMCPFCYIGKRKFENALAESDYKDEVEIIWKSYQLSPDLVTNPNQNIHQYLAEHKNVSLEQAKGMNDHVTRMAAQEGLVYKMDKAIPANSLKAHQLSHLAAQHGLQNQMEELLFAAYFTQGKNIDDVEVLVNLGVSAGLEEAEIREALEKEIYKNAVLEDIETAMQIGVRGVPFFVFDRKYAVSGAQAKEAFMQTMEAAFNPKTYS